MGGQPHSIAADDQRNRPTQAQAHPCNVVHRQEYGLAQRYCGACRVKLIKRDGQLLLTSTDTLLVTELTRRKELKPYILAQLNPATRRKSWPAMSLAKRCQPTRFVCD